VPSVFPAQSYFSTGLRTTLCRRIRDWPVRARSKLTQHTVWYNSPAQTGARRRGQRLPVYQVFLAKADGHNSIHPARENGMAQSLYVEKSGQPALLAAY